MSNQARTDAVSPHELARKSGLFTGEIPIAAFPRLSALVLAGGSVSVKLAFTRDDEGRTRVVGEAALTPTLQCQRCLEPVQRTLDVPIDLCVVTSDAQAAEIAQRIRGVRVDRRRYLDRRSGRRRSAAGTAEPGMRRRTKNVRGVRI